MERIREVYEHILMASAVWLPSKQIDHWRYICITSITRECNEIKETPVYSICRLKASYDWIPRDALFKCLEIRLKSPRLVSILRALYTGTKAYVKGSKHLFDTLVGCRQRALESSMLFDIYMDFVVRVARHEVLKKRPDSGIKIEYSVPRLKRLLIILIIFLVNYCPERDRKTKENRNILLFYQILERKDSSVSL